MLLAGVAVVLVAPRVPENIGATCRVAANYGVLDVRVAAPRCDVADPAAVRVAVESPAYARLTQHASLADALGDGALAVGLSRRGGATRRAAAPPRALFARGEATGLPRPRGAPTLALVFGREEAGLAADELALCGGGALSLPHVAPDYGSLNLSHAVAVALALAAGEAAANDGDSDGDGAAPSSPLDAPAPPATIDALVHRVAALAAALGLDGAESVAGTGNHGRKLRVAGHARSVLARAGATRAEVGAGHALLREVERAIGAVE